MSACQECPCGIHRERCDYHRAPPYGGLWGIYKSYLNPANSGWLPHFDHPASTGCATTYDEASSRLTWLRKDRDQAPGEEGAVYVVRPYALVLWGIRRRLRGDPGADCTWVSGSASVGVSLASEAQAKSMADYCNRTYYGYEYKAMPYV